MEKERIFVDGIYLNKVADSAPAFIKANVSIHVEKAIAWLRDQVPDEKGYVKIVGKEGKSGKRYFERDMWEPKSETPEYPKGDINPENIPF